MKTIIISTALLVLCQNVHAQSVPTQYGKSALPTLGTAVNGLPTKLPTHVGGGQMYPQVSPIIPNVVQILEGPPDANGKAEVQRPATTTAVKKDVAVEPEITLIQRVEAKNNSKATKTTTESIVTPSLAEGSNKEEQAYYPDWPSTANAKGQEAANVQNSTSQAPSSAYGKLFK